MPLCLIVVVIVFLLCFGFAAWIVPAFQLGKGGAVTVAVVWVVVILYVVLICWLHLFRG